MNVNFDVQTPNAHRIEVKMIKNNFIFGAAIANRMRGIMDEVFEIFNYGVMENEMKWGYQEQTEGNFNYDDSDWFVDWFDTHNIPLRRVRKIFLHRPLTPEPYTPASHLILTPNPNT